MFRPLSLIVAIFFTFVVSAQQEECTTPDATVADPNSITKCAVEEVDGNKKQVSIEVTTRRRVVRKNKKSAITTGGTHQVANVNQNTLLVGKLELEDTSDNIEKIPFNLVEEIPLFDKCNNVPIIKQAKCFETQMQKHIVKNFNFPQAAIEKGIGGRVLVQFTITPAGDVEDILLRGPKEGTLLEEEAKRIITKLPKFIPGKQNGKNVKVKYGIPITFKLPEGVTRTNVAAAKKKVVVKKAVVNEAVISDFVSFNKVEVVPQFKACKKVAADKKVDCFTDRIISHIHRNFYYPEGAAVNNIEGKVWVRFIIDKQGDVKNIKMRGPANGELLEGAAKKMVSNLPKFIPGTEGGQAVNVEYTIPISFRLSN